MTLQSKILLIYSGGTIGMQKSGENGTLKAFNFQKLLHKIPEIKQLSCEIDTFSFENPIDSSNMNPEKWVVLATVIEKNYLLYDGFVILHGTDTMSYTASALSFMFQNLQKPIIFTGSQLPIGDLRTDAKENLITAIQIASLKKDNVAVIQEVGLYFEHNLYRGNRTTKINSEHFNAFASSNYPPLMSSGVHLIINYEHLLPKNNLSNLKIFKDFDDNVMIIKIFPGIKKEIFAAMLQIPNLKGVVLETFGAGNAPTENWFLAEITAAIDRGLHIVNVTQCAAGSVNMGQYETGAGLKNIGLISGKDITTEAAITKMMFLLGQQIPKSDFKNQFETALCGEMCD